MGSEVAGVSRGAAVEESPSVRFGRWLARERSVRGISREYVAVRFKTSPTRIREIEEGRASLTPDRRGRATARSLARAIGADPEEAAVRLVAAHPDRLASARPAKPRAPRPPIRWLFWGQVAALVLVSGLGGWGVVAWLGRAPGADEIPAPVRRSDYVEALRGRLGPASDPGGARLSLSGPSAKLGRHRDSAQLR